MNCKHDWQYLGSDIHYPLIRETFICTQCNDIKEDEVLKGKVLVTRFFEGNALPGNGPYRTVRK